MGHLPPAPLGLADHAPLRACATASARASIRGATRPAEQKKFFDHVAGIFRAEGGDAWYARPAEDFLPPGADRRGLRATSRRRRDILDVWFDSGVSHLAVLRSGEWPELVAAGRAAARRPLPRGPRPAPRLVPVVAADLGRALRRRALRRRHHARLRRRRTTGRKMSKSLGNVVAPQDLITKYGADILRLWVARLDYRDDDPISEEILARCAEAYRKIRNTARYLISNLYDFDPATDAVADVGARCRSTAGRSARPAPLADRIREAYEALRVPRRLPPARELLRDDALGVLPATSSRTASTPPRPNSRERRSAQTALYRIARALATALGARPRRSRPRRSGQALPGKKEESVHLARFETLDDARAATPSAAAAWERLTKLREEVSVILEEARREKVIGSSLEGAIALTGQPAALAADRAATGTAGTGPRRPLHRVRDRRGGLRGRRRLARVRRPIPGSDARASARRADAAATAAGRSRRRRRRRASATAAAGPRGSRPRERPHERASPIREIDALPGAPTSSSRSRSCFLDQWTKGIITRTFEVHQSRTDPRRLLRPDLRAQQRRRLRPLRLGRLLDQGDRA